MDHEGLSDDYRDFLRFWGRVGPRSAPPRDFDELLADEAWRQIYGQWLVLVQHDRERAKALNFLVRARGTTSLADCVNIIRMFIQQQDEPVVIPWQKHADWSEALRLIGRHDSDGAVRATVASLSTYDRLARQLVRPPYLLNFQGTWAGHARSLPRVGAVSLVPLPKELRASELG